MDRAPIKFVGGPHDGLVGDVPVPWAQVYFFPIKRPMIQNYYHLPAQEQMLAELAGPSKEVYRLARQRVVREDGTRYEELVYKWAGQE